MNFPPSVKLGFEISCPDPEEAERDEEARRREVERFTVEKGRRDDRAEEVEVEVVGWLAFLDRGGRSKFWEGEGATGTESDGVDRS